MTTKIAWTWVATSNTLSLSSGFLQAQCMRMTLMVSVMITDLIIHWIELSHLSKLKAFLAGVILLPGPQSHEINMALVLKK